MLIALAMDKPSRTFENMKSMNRIVDEEEVPRASEQPASKTGLV